MKRNFESFYHALHTGEQLEPVYCNGETSRASHCNASKEKSTAPEEDSCVCRWSVRCCLLVAAKRLRCRSQHDMIKTAILGSRCSGHQSCEKIDQGERTRQFGPALARIDGIRDVLVY
jgi:hypothetical protein